MSGIARPRITARERRARLVRRQLLHPAARAADVSEAAQSVLALHATDAATVHLSAAARLADPRPEAVERGLYARESLLRMTAMRCTVFVTPTALAPVLLAAAGRPQAAVRRKQLLRQIESSGIGEERWLEQVSRDVLAALAERGEASTAELAAAYRALSGRSSSRPASATSRAVASPPTCCSSWPPTVMPYARHAGAAGPATSTLGLWAPNSLSSPRQRHGSSWSGSGSAPSAPAPSPT